MSRVGGKQMRGANISISRTSNTHTGDDIRITIEDGESSTIVFEGRMTLDDFARAVTGQGHIDMYDARVQSDTVGTQHQSKTMLVEVPPNLSYNDKAAARAVLKPYEIDGWRGYDSDVTNHHRRRGDRNGMHVYEVTFFRNVSTEGMPRCPECDFAEPQHHHRCELGERLRLEGLRNTPRAARRSKRT